jgi:hypothetical protein
MSRISPRTHAQCSREILGSAVCMFQEFPRQELCQTRIEKSTGLCVAVEACVALEVYGGWFWEPSVLAEVASPREFRIWTKSTAASERNRRETPTAALGMRGTLTSPKTRSTKREPSPPTPAISV